MSNYFTMYYYIIVGVAVLAFHLSLLLPTILIVGVAVLAFTYHSGYHCYSYYLSDCVEQYFVATPPLHIGSTRVLFVATTFHVSEVHILK